MPAYVVMEMDERTGGVVFAKDKRTAERIGANKWADGEIGYVEVTRRADFDRYEDTGVPARILVEEGWHFECHGCGMRIDDSTFDDEGLPVSGIVGNESGAVYCCHTCRMQAQGREAQIKAFGDAFLDMLRDVVRTRFGEVEFVAGDSWGNHVYISRSYDPLVVSEASVAFNFLGQKIAPATLDYRHTIRPSCIHPSGMDTIGPAECRFHCCNGDREAFEAWAEITKLHQDRGRN